VEEVGEVTEVATRPLCGSGKSGKSGREVTEVEEVREVGGKEQQAAKGEIATQPSAARNDGRGTRRSRACSVYRESTRRRPLSMDLIKREGRRPHFSVRNSRSTVMSWETLTTESFGSPDADAGRSTLPGASARRRLDVTTTAMTVRMRLRLKAFDWTITTGRRKPGSDATGSGNCAHQMFPRSITSPHGAGIWPAVG